ncbi:hypothetical protein Bbelb_295660 [Branchiostoma belcheri]|nr:hypothetical protein Bbelb_295660 [Branchiostoma belcheri]
MANPRKFSEKIALHNQKQAEETAAFEQIMKEVSGATRASAGAQYQKMQMAQALGAYRGGSLPNVNQIGTGAIDLQGALHSLEDIKRGAQPGFVDRRPGFDRSRMLAAQHRNRLAPFEKRQISFWSLVGLCPVVVSQPNPLRVTPSNPTHNLSYNHNVPPVAPGPPEPLLEG